MRDDQCSRTVRTHGFDGNGGFLVGDKYFLGGRGRGDELQDLQGWSVADVGDDSVIIGYRSPGEHRLLLYRFSL